VVDGISYEFSRII